MTYDPKKPNRTPTGRIYSEPRFREFPMRTEFGRKSREILDPKKDYCFIEADYSAVEFRVYSLLSAEERKSLWCCDVYPRREFSIRGIPGEYAQVVGPVINSKEEPLK
jgi:hypothetical protein